MARITGGMLPRRPQQWFGLAVAVGLVTLGVNTIAKRVPAVRPVVDAIRTGL